MVMDPLEPGFLIDKELNIQYHNDTNVKASKTLSSVRRDSEVARILRLEAERQANSINLIASENHASRAVMEAQDSVLTDKYAEGYSGRRYYGGCVYADAIEDLAVERAKKLFGAEHANVQAHSGTQANMAAYSVLLNHGDTE